MGAVGYLREDAMHQHESDRAGDRLEEWRGPIDCTAEHRTENEAEECIEHRRLPDEPFLAESYQKNAYDIDKQRTAHYMMPGQILRIPIGTDDAMQNAGKVHGKMCARLQ